MIRAIKCFGVFIYVVAYQQCNHSRHMQKIALFRLPVHKNTKMHGIITKMSVSETQSFPAPVSIVGLSGLTIIITAFILIFTLLRLDGSHRDVDLWRHRETERLANLGKVELVNIKDLFKRVRRIGLKVRPVSIPRRRVEVMVLGNQALELLLHICNLFLRELILVERNFGDLEEAKEAKLARQKEKERLSRFACTCSTADTVDVVSGVIRRVELDDPVNLGDVETTCSDVGAEEDTSGGIDELKESVCTLLLLLFTLPKRVSNVQRGG